MSVVTNIILSWAASGDDEFDKKWLDEVNAYLTGEGVKEGYRLLAETQGHRRGFVDVGDPSLPNGWYGGTKYLECFVAIAAFNYLDLDGLIDFLKTRTWFEGEEEYMKESLQLIVKEQEDMKFRIVDIFPDYVDKE